MQKGLNENKTKKLLNSDTNLVYTMLIFSREQIKYFNNSVGKCELKFEWNKLIFFLWNLKINSILIKRDFDLLKINAFSSKKQFTDEYFPPDEKSISFEINENTSPLEYFRVNQTALPVLSQIAKQLHAITATSVPSECLFSSAGEVTTDTRNRLDPEHVESILLIQQNKHVDQIVV